CSLLSKDCPSRIHSPRLPIRRFITNAPPLFMFSYSWPPGPHEFELLGAAIFYFPSSFQLSVRKLSTLNVALIAQDYYHIPDNGANYRYHIKGVLTFAYSHYMAYVHLPSYSDSWCLFN